MDLARYDWQNAIWDNQQYRRINILTQIWYNLISVYQISWSWHIDAIKRLIIVICISVDDLEKSSWAFNTVTDPIAWDLGWACHGTLNSYDVSLACEGASGHSNSWVARYSCYKCSFLSTLELPKPRWELMGWLCWGWDWNWDCCESVILASLSFVLWFWRELVLSIMLQFTLSLVLELILLLRLLSLRETPWLYSVM